MIAYLKTHWLFSFKHRLLGLSLFFHELLTNPVAMGAACPSSKRLARAMAKQVSRAPNGIVVELGPGTGVVTQALLEQGICPEKIVVIERSVAFVKHLKRRFEKINVCEGNAQDLTRWLADYPEVSVIVSSLPLRSLPTSVVEQILQAVDRVLAKDGVFIQFTYYHGATPLPLLNHFQRIHSEQVLLNFPPRARGCVFTPVIFLSFKMMPYFVGLPLHGILELVQNRN